MHCVSVWYYFTVTIRELILINNGSKSVVSTLSSVSLAVSVVVCVRINWWWMTHHYCSIAVSGLLLGWYVYM